MIIIDEFLYNPVTFRQYLVNTENKKRNSKYTDNDEKKFSTDYPEKIINANKAIKKLREMGLNFYCDIK